MKNNTVIQAFQTVEPGEAARARMFRQILDRAGPGKKNTREVIPMKKTIKWLAPAAACLILVIVLIATPLLRGGEIALSHSSGNVKVRYTNNPPNLQMRGDLVPLTEEEIFGEWASVIFRGTVKEIRNIVIDFNGDKDYRAIAKITVAEVYHGNITKDDVISILLPCPITSGIWVEDTDVISQLTVGMRGIFMPRKYAEDDYWEQNGAKLDLCDIAEYGFGDGERFAFLEAENGLVYASWAYPSLSINATVEDVKAWVNSNVQ